MVDNPPFSGTMPFVLLHELTFLTLLTLESVSQRHKETRVLSIIRPDV
jgi:hypothetical protein